MFDKHISGPNRHICFLFKSIHIVSIHLTFMINTLNCQGLFHLGLRSSSSILKKTRWRQSTWIQLNPFGSRQLLLLVDIYRYTELIIYLHHYLTLDEHFNNIVWFISIPWICVKATQKVKRKSIWTKWSKL